MGQVVWTDPALADLEALHDYIHRDSPTYANRMVRRIVDKTKALEAHPYVGWEVQEFPNSSEREIAIWPYRILYHLNGEVAVIDAVIHGSRDIEKVFGS